MKQFIHKRLCPIMTDLFERIAEGGLTLTLDGMPAYNEKAQFVGGKVINFACYTAMELLKTDESFEKLGSMIRMASDMEMETWGILNGITGLYRLKKAGLLEKVVDAGTLEKMKLSMDWRKFVNVEDHYALIDKPTNYYGVAFGIARHRELWGWDEEGHSRKLLDRLLEHIDNFSGEFLFMDETPGEGRFDRYSILVPSELVSQLLETGWEIPEKIYNMLQRSAQVFLHLANEEGMGFSYGRSIGAYGDTAALEVLSAAVRAGVFRNQEEIEIAYGYSLKLLDHIVDFWFDEEMQSVNMWEKGRKTDNYRNKNRILGENLALCMQMVNSIEHWDAAGYGSHEICGDFREKLRQLCPFYYIPFAKGQYERGLAIVRDGRHVWSLPLINGGTPYYDKDPYMPVPFENMVLQGVPECSHRQLVPQFLLENGEVLMPIAYFRTITHLETPKGAEIVCIMDELCRMGISASPQKAEGVSVKTIYCFEKNRISRKDEIKMNGLYRVQKIRLVLLTYSDLPEVKDQRVRFGEGVITSMQTQGYDTCTATAALEDGSFDTPHGRLGSEVVWEREAEPDEDSFSLGWQSEYQP